VGDRLRRARPLAGTLVGEGAAVRRPSLPPAPSLPPHTRPPGREGGGKSKKFLLLQPPSSPWAGGREGGEEGRGGEGRAAAQSPHSSTYFGVKLAVLLLLATFA